jgi:hypothetical protein
MELNDKQRLASSKIQEFLLSAERTFLLMGPAGSGKSTVIVDALKNCTSVVFSAFSNRATQVLQAMCNRKNFNAQCITIHKLLSLKPLVKNNTLTYEYKPHTLPYDIIVIDECSCVSTELYSYICTSTKNSHVIYCGDFWQLPPVGEKSSIVFGEAVKNNWDRARLTAVMRAATASLTDIHQNMGRACDVIKAKHYDEFINDFPTSYINRNVLISSSKLYDKYLNSMRTHGDCVILTYSKVNCEKINDCIREIIDEGFDRIPWKFYPKHRATLITPHELISMSDNTDVLTYEKNLETTAYPGDIYEVVDATDVKVVTSLNMEKYSIAPYFNAQKLTLRLTQCDAHITSYHINPEEIELAYECIARYVHKYTLYRMKDFFHKRFPTWAPGYCINVYKSQGSEWRDVYVNLNSIYASCIRASCSSSDVVHLYRTVYTAVTRAKSSVYCTFNG